MTYPSPKPARPAAPVSAPPAQGQSLPAQTKRRKAVSKPGMLQPGDAVRYKGAYDRPLLILVLLLVCFGSVMVFSSSYAYAFSKYGDSFHYIKRQLLFVAIGGIAMLAAMVFDYLWLRKAVIPAYLATLVLLLIVLLYGVASRSAKRWIPIGSFTLQPSEILKFSLVLILALYIARNQDRITNYSNRRQSNLYGVILPGIIIGVSCLLVALEKHFSGTIIIFLIGMIVLFTGGARMGWFLGIGAAGLLALAPFLLFTDYARSRLTTWLHPDTADQLGEAWQSTQGLNAVGSGGFLGVGLGYSRQKHLFVSEPQNDFIFSIVCEELGFVGAISVVLLFALLIWRGYVIALKAPDTFSSLVAIGITSKVAIQAILNICVVTGLLPNTGVALPFFSYGGTALIMQMGEMGVLLSISRYSHQKK